MSDLLSDGPARCPRYLLELVQWLPDDGAFAASLRGGSEHYGKGSLWHILADQWDLDAAVAMAGSKKKAPTYPRPGAKKRGGGTPLMAFMPRRRPVPAPEVPSPAPSPQRGPRVAGHRKGR